jgi:type III restriction enzyme
MYDSKNLTSLKNFATSNAIQVLVINIDSFSKDSNIINTVRETGVKPIEYIQATNAIAIIDEPQNMETDVRRSAIQNLNPLCTLRYSATHRNFYNLLYSLNPVQAYDLGLVKQIEVDGITSDSNYNAAFIQVKKIESGKKNLKVKVAIYVNDKSGVTQKDITLALGEDLFEKSNRRDIYKDGFSKDKESAVDASGGNR